MPKLINPQGREISVNPSLYNRLKKDARYTVVDKKKSVDYKVDDVKEMTKTMTDEEIQDFIEGDERKSVEKL